MTGHDDGRRSAGSPAPRAFRTWLLAGGALLLASTLAALVLEDLHSARGGWERAPAGDQAASRGPASGGHTPAVPRGGASVPGVPWLGSRLPGVVGPGGDAGRLGYLPGTAIETPPPFDRSRAPAPPVEPPEPSLGPPAETRGVSRDTP